MLHIKRAPHEGFLRKTGAIRDQMPDRSLPVLHILVDDRYIPVLVKEMQRCGGDPPFLPLHDLRDLVPAHHAFISAPRKTRQPPPRQDTEAVLVAENGIILFSSSASFLTIFIFSDPAPEKPSKVFGLGQHGSGLLGGA